MVYLEFGKIVREALLLLLSFGIVYTAIGLFWSVCAIYAASCSEKGFKREITEGIGATKTPFPIIFFLFFSCITWGWPFIMRHMRKRKQEEALQEAQREKERLKKLEELRFK